MNKETQCAWRCVCREYEYVTEWMSECGHVIYTDDKYMYCPYCGKMIVFCEKDDNDVSEISCR